MIQLHTGQTLSDSHSHGNSLIVIRGQTQNIDLVSNSLLTGVDRNSAVCSIQFFDGHNQAADTGFNLCARRNNSLNSSDGSCIICVSQFDGFVSLAIVVCIHNGFRDRNIGCAGNSGDSAFREQVRTAVSNVAAVDGQLINCDAHGAEFQLAVAADSQLAGHGHTVFAVECAGGGLQSVVVQVQLCVGAADLVGSIHVFNVVIQNDVFGALECLDQLSLVVDIGSVHGDLHAYSLKGLVDIVAHMLGLDSLGSHVDLEAVSAHSKGLLLGQMAGDESLGEDRHVTGFGILGFCCQDVVVVQVVHEGIGLNCGGNAIDLAQVYVNKLGHGNHVCLVNILPYGCLGHNDPNPDILVIRTGVLHVCHLGQGISRENVLKDKTVVLGIALFPDIYREDVFGIVVLRPCYKKIVLHRVVVGKPRQRSQRQCGDQTHSQGQREYLFLAKFHLFSTSFHNFLFKNHEQRARSRL